jgi:T-complex protein 1 subunit theta
MNKMVINSLEKLFVTADAANILKELDVVHPAAKLAVMAAQRQEEEVCLDVAFADTPIVLDMVLFSIQCGRNIFKNSFLTSVALQIGDFTNLVLVIAGELLSQAESLLRSGLHTNDIITGYEKALVKAQTILESAHSCSALQSHGVATHSWHLYYAGLTAWKVDDLRNEEQAAKAIKTSIASKQHGFEDVLAPVIARACISVLSQKGSLNVDNVRVAKILGGGVTDLEVVKGFVMVRGADGSVKNVKNAKVAVYTQGIDFAKTEAKDTVLITKASQLENFAIDQESQMEKIIKEIADAGINVIVAGGKVRVRANTLLYRMLRSGEKSLTRFAVFFADGRHCHALH